MDDEDGATGGTETANAAAKPPANDRETANAEMSRAVLLASVIVFRFLNLGA